MTAKIRGSVVTPNQTPVRVTINAAARSRAQERR